LETIAAGLLAGAEALSFKVLQQSKTAEMRDASIYPPGSAYALCQAQAQLAAVVLAIMNESMIEYIRGLTRFDKHTWDLDP
jgi:Protein of unknown function (DUF3808)